MTKGTLFPLRLNELLRSKRHGSISISGEGIIVSDKNQLQSEMIKDPLRFKKGIKIGSIEKQLYNNGFLKQKYEFGTLFIAKSDAAKQMTNKILIGSKKRQANIKLAEKKVRSKKASASEKAPVSASTIALASDSVKAPVFTSKPGFLDQQINSWYERGFSMSNEQPHEYDWQTYATIIYSTDEQEIQEALHKIH